MLDLVASLQLSTGPPTTYPTIRHFLTPTDHHDHLKPHQLHHLHHQYSNQAVILIIANFDFIVITSIFFVIIATRRMLGAVVRRAKVTHEGSIWSATSTSFPLLPSSISILPSTPPLSLYLFLYFYLYFISCF